MYNNNVRTEIDSSKKTVFNLNKKVKRIGCVERNCTPIPRDGIACFGNMHPPLTRGWTPHGKHAEVSPIPHYARKQFYFLTISYINLASLNEQQFTTHIS